MRRIDSFFSPPLQQMMVQIAKRLENQVLYRENLDLKLRDFVAENQIQLPKAELDRFIRILKENLMEVATVNGTSQRRGNGLDSHIG